MTVDPNVYELADRFVGDTVRALNRPILPSLHLELIERAARAMQQAIEDECESIREEQS